jgi:hypothetical protein
MARLATEVARCFCIDRTTQKYGEISHRRTAISADSCVQKCSVLARLFANSQFANTKPNTRAPVASGPFVDTDVQLSKNLHARWAAEEHSDVGRIPMAVRLGGEIHACEAGRCSEVGHLRPHAIFLGEIDYRMVLKSFVQERLYEYLDDRRLVDQPWLVSARTDLPRQRH